MTDILEFKFMPFLDRWRLALHVLFGYNNIVDRHQTAAEQLRTAINRLARDDAHAQRILDAMYEEIQR